MVGAVQAQQVPQSGAHLPVPEHIVPYNRNFELRAQLVVDRTGAAPLALDMPLQLRFDLSLRAMDPGAEKVENKFRQHWQESREGGSGGYCAAGGGCGCN